MAENQRILVCAGTGCASSGAHKVIDALRAEIKLQGLEETVSIVGTGCQGFCEKGPTLVIEEHQVLYTSVTADDVAEIVATDIIKGERVERLLYVDPANQKPISKLSEIGFFAKQNRIILGNCGVIDPQKIAEYTDRKGYSALQKVLKDMSQAEVIEEVKKSGLRGRGGAGFPTGLKWGFCNGAAGDKKYVICNADEGDPGAFMDRSVLEGDPHSVLEAMIIAGKTVGASQGYIYIRAEYPLAITRLETAIAQAHAHGLLGRNILGSGFQFDIELRLGAGAFVCGEETALLASVEGKRGTPSPRPPFPAVRGLWGKPTVINNVETLANIPVILLKGGDWFGQIGTANSKGTKVFALTGKINNSGLIEVPMGTTLREIIFEIGGGIRAGHTFKAAQTGGPSGGVIPPEFLDTPIDYENLGKIGSIMGSGGLIVMDDTDCMVDVAKFYLEFTVDESCGKCAPCRIGGRTLFNYLEKITAGKAVLGDLDQMRDICQAMQRASLCGLGQTAPNPVLSSLRYFPDEYQEHIVERKCRASKCKNLLRYGIDPAKCVGCTACARVCPVTAITGERKQAHVIDQAKCIKCGQCFEVCKFHAVQKA